MGDIRQAISAVTKVDDINQHAELMSTLSGHTVAPISKVDRRAPCANEYTCFPYALELADSDDYRMIAARFWWVFADAEFITYLIARGILHAIDRQATQEGDIVIYFDTSGVPVHAGKVFDDRVTSKWGSGLLWEHALFEVPESYGKVTLFYRRIGRSAAESAFLDYVVSKNIDLERWPEWRRRTREGQNAPNS